MRFFLVLLGISVLAGGALAQAQVEVDTVGAPLFPDRTSFEDGWLSRLSLDREPQGGRSIGMGGTGIAASTGPQGHLLNPASILGVVRPELGVEAKYYSGGAGVSAFPSELDVGTPDPLEAKDYRVNPREIVGYNGLSLGMPVVLFGQHGVFGLSYRRSSLTGFRDETRVELQGALTNQAEATFGLGDEPEDGLDAITLTAAREVTPWLDLGANINWQSGTLGRETSTGISVFGNTFSTGSSDFQQDVSSVNLDAGGRLEFGRLNLGGVIYLGHDLKFENGEATTLTLPAPPAFSSRLLVLGQPLDHSLSVPTMFGLGSSYAVNERLNVAVDFWIRPWSNAEITRTRMEPVLGFADPSDSSTYFFTLVPADNDSLWNLFANHPDPSIASKFQGSDRQESFNAGFANTNSIRVGLEYFFKKSDRVDLPVRLGYRRENLTLTNITIPDFDKLADPAGIDTLNSTYVDFINGYWHDLQEDPSCQSDECKRRREFLEKAAEHNHLAFQGEPVKSTTITLGFGVRVENWSADLTIERTSFDYDRFFLTPFDPLLNPLPDGTQESRRLLNVVVSSTMRF